MKYIDAERLIVELKKRIQDHLDAGGATSGVYLSERMKEDSYILSFIDTLDVLSKPPVLSNIDEAALRFTAQRSQLDNGDSWSTGDFGKPLQQERQEKKEVKFVFPKFLYARTTNNKTIDVSYAPQSLDAIEYIRSDSLQQEQDTIVINKKDWEALEQFQKNKDFGKPIQQEQPEVDLEKETKRFLSNATKMNKGEWRGKYPISDIGFRAVARYFYELGSNARKEE